MATFNPSGIKPAFRRLTMDMSVTLGQVLNFEAAKPGSFHVVNVRGQINRAYAPAQVQDFMEWLLAVASEWQVTSTPNTEDAPVTVEHFDIHKFATAYSSAAFIKHLAHLLHQGSITILMSCTQTEIESEAGLHPFVTHELCIEIIHRHHVKVLEFKAMITPPQTDAIEEFSNDLLIEMSGGQALVIDPYHVAVVMQRNARKMGYARKFCGVTATCGALVGRNGTVENVVPLTNAMNMIDTVIMNNLSEYGFKLAPQLLLLKALHAQIFSSVMAYSLTDNLPFEENLVIKVDFSFLDDDRATYKSTPWNTVIVTVTPEVIPTDTP